MREKNRLFKKYVNGFVNYFIYMEKKRNCVVKFLMCFFVSVKILRKNKLFLKMV